MRKTPMLAAVLAAAALACGSAGAAMMHPVLGANLSGMGEKGVVNLTSEPSKNQLCWTFDVMAHGITAASIVDGSGMVVAKLGPTYKAKSCAMVSMKTLDAIETTPGSYHVWVDAGGHMGELRGTLFSGMAHMSKM
jgi:hypothetical protein